MKTSNEFKAYYALSPPHVDTYVLLYFNKDRIMLLSKADWTFELDLVGTLFESCSFMPCLEDVEWLANDKRVRFKK